MDFLMDVKLYLSFIITSFVIADDIGSEQTLTCENSEYAPYCLWQRQSNNGSFFDLQKNESKYLRSFTTIMTIKKLTSSDSGTYRCRLFWKTKRTVYSSYIRLYVVDKGTNFTLKCKDEPQRHPSYTWEKNKLDTSFKTQMLILQEIRYQDAGTYRCKYYWSGSPWHYGIITVIVVQDMKLPQLSTPNTTMHAAIGSDIVLACIVVQTRPQTRHVWWTKLNDERQTNISDLNLQRYHGGTFQKPSLKILDVTLKDSAEYRCHGENKNGNNYAAMQLITGYTPWVSLPHETKEVIKGSDTVLDCSYDAYPKPTKVYWMKDDDIIKQSNTIKTTYNGSSVEMSVLILHDTNQSDAGNYVCVVENSFGTGYSKILQITIKDTPSSERKENAYKKPLIISLPMIGTILVFVGLMVCFKRRQRNSSHYERPDFKQGDVHRYSTARNADEYDLPITTNDVNTLRTSGSLDKINELKGNRAFTVNEFLQLFNDTDKFKRHIQLEFQDFTQPPIWQLNLTESYNTNQSGGEYYNETESFMTHKNPPEHSTYLNTALTMNENCTLFISSVPQSNSIGQFWKFVSKNGVEQIILLNKENQQVAEFYPVSDKAIEMKYLRLELDSSEKKNKNLFLFHLQLKHQDRKSSIPVKIYKTTNWKEKDKHLPLEVLSQLLDVTRSSKSKSALLMTKDDLDICMAGILKICADVFRAIDESTSFSVFQIAKEARNQHPTISLEITDYELCYLLIQHHLESNHLYVAID